MAAENTINILKWWYPEGMDMTVDHDYCDTPTGRYDLEAYLPKCDAGDCAFKRTPVQNWVNTRNRINKWRDKFVWRQEGYKNYDNYDVDGVMLLMSMKFLGSDQYLYDRPDTWHCFWKGIELASIGWNDPAHMLSYEKKNYFFKGMEKSTWPDGDKSPLVEPNNCGVPFTYPVVPFNVEAWMFQRVFTPSLGSDYVGSVWAKGNDAVEKTFAACRFWYESHSWGNARTIPFGKETPAQKYAADYPQYFPGGMPLFPNPYQGYGPVAEGDPAHINVEDWDMPWLVQPATSGTGGFNASGYVITPPPADYKGQYD